MLPLLQYDYLERPLRVALSYPTNFSFPLIPPPPRSELLTPLVFLFCPVCSMTEFSKTPRWRLFILSRLFYPFLGVPPGSLTPEVPLIFLDCSSVHNRCGPGLCIRFSLQYRPESNFPSLLFKGHFFVCLPRAQCATFFLDQRKECFCFFFFSLFYFLPFFPKVLVDTQLSPPFPELFSI